jgi:hypothetical protein
MFDSNGATGGCQAVYTVYPTTGEDLRAYSELDWVTLAFAIDEATGAPPTCTNVTFPQPMNVGLTQGKGETLSRYGFINQVG